MQGVGVDWPVPYIRVVGAYTTACLQCSKAKLRGTRPKLAVGVVAVFHNFATLNGTRVPLLHNYCLLKENERLYTSPETLDQCYQPGG